MSVAATRARSQQSTPSVQPRSSNTSVHVSAIKYAHQAAKLSHLPQDAEGTNDGATAVDAEWITPQDPVVITADGGRLPGVPLAEARKLDQLKDEVDVGLGKGVGEVFDEKGEGAGGSASPANGSSEVKGSIQRSGEGSLTKAMPPSRTNPLFPPLPLYGPPSLLRNLQCTVFRCTSAVLSLAFLGVIVLGSTFTSIPLMFSHIWIRLKFQNPDKRRPFYGEEKRRSILRKEGEQEWRKKKARRQSTTVRDDNEADAGQNNGFTPTEGGPDPLICDVAYYARRVGLDMEEFKVQTEDGFLIDLWHIYDPSEYTPLPPASRSPLGPSTFPTSSSPPGPDPETKKKPKYPILMIHGLLQSAGAYCTNDDASLAFYLCKSGYDVWLGNNRCGFSPQHTLLSYSDPRMWAWNIRQMGVLDLPALVARVLSATGAPKLGLVAHSQGTTQTLVALAKEQRPDLGERISVFCALAPAAYAGPLIGKMYFKFMRLISPGAFTVFFGIHAFIPFMMTMHSLLPGTLYGALGYRVFSFLFGWSDDRWDRGLRDRMFQFSPVYVSAESMRWWLGRERFAKQKCILQTREEWREEDRQDGVEEEKRSSPADAVADLESGVEDVERGESHAHKASTAWYDHRAPPFALWVAGSDLLVDGRRLLRRFASGREPHVRVVHQKVIEEYEHLDVIWAVDVVEQVGREVKEVLWATCEGREGWRVPVGCEGVGVWDGKGKGGEGSGSAEGSGESEGI
jgi:pimeloyl-ACP methyl ester carboxylesterase